MKVPRSTPKAAVKIQALRQSGTLNRRGGTIRDRLFLEESFFDPQDLTQVKYEMLRRVETDGKSVTEAAASFGFSLALKQQLLQSDYALVHQHGLWQFISMAVSRWHQHTRRPYLISPPGMLDDWALKNSPWKKRIAGWWV